MKATERPRRMVCACCGAETRGRQWWNRDDGYGICPRCWEWVKDREPERERLYGIPGIHHSLPENDRQPWEAP